MTGQVAQRSLLKTIDWYLVGAYLLLVLIGWLNIYASEYDPENIRSIFSWEMRSGKQLVWIGTSFLLGMLILFFISPRNLETLSPLLYGVMLFLLVAVIFLGASTRGSHSWFVLGPVSFQPAELSKITTALLLANRMSRYDFRLTHWRDFLLTAAIILLPMLIIVAENETGSALVYLSFLFVLYREGLSGWWLLLLLMVIIVFIFTLVLSPYVALWVTMAVAAVCVCAERMNLRRLFRFYLPLGLLLAFYPLIYRTWLEESFWAFLCPSRVLLAAASVMIVGYWVKAWKEKNSFRMFVAFALVLGLIITRVVPWVFQNVLQDHQRIRIEVLLGMKEDPAGAGYNVRQSMIAIGSGGFWGKGWLQGTQSSYGFVPEQSTDFIFCTIGEQWGFSGCLLTIALYVFLIGRIMVLSEGSREAFTRIYGYSIAGIVLMHLIVNVGMTIGLMPVIGIPLPFLSYGGSSLWSFSIMIFIFVALIRSEKKYFL
ncbi:MAG: rod shape-determining protein RodA [Bacteroidales bacterium]|nr:rod shape-determining protein RodA [Bacteroidales bacterium]